MAKQIITKIIDDLDGGTADETVTFAIDGVNYEIDLSAKNAGQFREFMARFQDAGTRLGRHESGRPAQLRGYARPQSTANREENQRIREWAADNGWEVSERGRIPHTVIEAFQTRSPHPAKVAADQEAAKIAAEVKTAPASAPAKRTRVRKPTFSE